MNPMAIPTIRVVAMVIPNRTLWDMPSWVVANGLVSPVEVPWIGSLVVGSVGTITGAALGEFGAFVVGRSDR